MKARVLIRCSPRRSPVGGTRDRRWAGSTHRAILHTSLVGASVPTSWLSSSPSGGSCERLWYTRRARKLVSGRAGRDHRPADPHDRRAPRSRWRRLTHHDRTHVAAQGGTVRTTVPPSHGALAIAAGVDPAARTRGISLHLVCQTARRAPHSVS